MDENTPLLQSQAHKLSRNPLLIIFPALALIQFISYLDQTANSTSLNAVAAGVHAGDSISLIGASFLITSTSIQLINRRLSDIFGRKFCLTIALSILGIGNLLSGFSTGPTELFLSRAFTGFGAGAINALVQIAIADITTLEQRGYYFGMIGAAVALGNGLGPSIGGYLTQLAGWQWSFWFICPLIPCAIIYLLLVWPISAPVTSATWYDLKLVDWFGALTSLGSISLFTIAISQGGSGIAWISPVMAALLCGGSVLACVFALIEWKYANLPMLPARLFKYGCSTNILISTNLAIGWIYWGNLFILPLYFQTIRGMGAGESGLWILPITISHGLTSATTGIIISMCKCYKPVILTGAICWTVAALVKLRYSDQTSARTIFLMGILDGVGVGCSMQPVLVGLFVQSNTGDRAVMTGFRNFLRDLGGGLGIAASGAILNNIVFTELKTRFSEAFISQLQSSGFNLKDILISDKDRAFILARYMKGIRGVFLSYAAVIVVHLCACVFIDDYGLSGTDGESQENHGIERAVLRTVGS